ncbi:MAG: hypothetical protein BMS9Abin20_1446 [Acidimicrobiia bacterium]|nr:MAG: hypothetical protein BMS9Abin20_1446 [Acidimicrobiia bacterium]
MTAKALLYALETDSPEDVESWCRGSLGHDADVFRTVLRKALEGSPTAAFDYVQAWRSLSQSLLAAIRTERPDLVTETDGGLQILDATGTPGSASWFIIETEALNAPFSPWVTRTNDLGVGACAALLQTLRTALVGLHPVAIDAPALPNVGISVAQLDAFRRNVTRALSHDEADIDRIQRIFGLSITDLGRLFGVTRQAVAQWRSSEVPPARLAKVSTVGSIADLLDSQLKSDRIPGIVRRPAPVYRGRSILEMIQEDQHNAVLDQARSSFEWAIPA